MNFLDGLLGGDQELQMALYSGLLGGGFAGGAKSLQEATRYQKESKRRGLLDDMQMENYRSESDARRAKIAQDQRKQDLIGSIFGAGGLSAPQVSPGAFAPSADGMGPTMPPSMAGLSAPGSRMAKLGFDQLAALKANGMDLVDLHKYANDPLKMEQGATYKDRVTGDLTHMPKLPEGMTRSGNFYDFVPNFVEATARQKGAETAATEDAKAARDLVQVTLPGGGTKWVTRASVIAQQQPPSQPSPFAPRASSSAPESGLRAKAAGDMGADPAAIRREIQTAVTDLTTKQLDPQSRQLLEAHVQNMSRQLAAIQPSGVQSVQQSQVPDFLATPSTAQRTAAKAQEAYGEGVAKDLVDQRKTIMAGGFSAPGTIAKYQQLGKLLEGVDGGALTATGTNIASAMNSMGFKIDKNLSNKEAAAALGNEMALQLRSPAGGAGMPGAMSDKDREFLVGMIPNAGQTLQGRKMLIQAQIAIEQRKQQVATFARNYEKKYGQLDNGFFEQMQAWSSANPMFGDK